MSALVIAEHDHGTLKGATLNTVTAALQCGGEVHVLIAGHNAGGAAQAAAAIKGVTKVLHADAASLAEQLAENVAAQVLTIAKEYRIPIETSAPINGISRPSILRVAP